MITSTSATLMWEAEIHSCFQKLDLRFDTLYYDSTTKTATHVVAVLLVTNIYTQILTRKRSLNQELPRARLRGRSNFINKLLPIGRADDCLMKCV